MISEGRSKSQHDNCPHFSWGKGIQWLLRRPEGVVFLKPYWYLDKKLFSFQKSLDYFFLGLIIWTLFLLSIFMSDTTLFFNNSGKTTFVNGCGDRYHSKKPKIVYMFCSYQGPISKLENVSFKNFVGKKSTSISFIDI